MAGFLDDLSARIGAILAGSFPVGAPWIPAETFTVGGTFLPAQNPRFPATAIVERRFDIVWQSLSFDPLGSENSTQGPWVRSARALVRVQYKIRQAPALAPSRSELVLGALETATRRALDDAALIQWALLRPGAFTDLAVGALLDQDATAEKVDTMRVVGTTRVRFLVSQSAVTSPGIAP